MTCPSCGAPNPHAARYCQQCGSRLGAPCSRCGAATWPSARYCTECGAALALAADGADPTPQGVEPIATAGAVPADALPEERRLVTVLFADVVGFTSLNERLDPEEVRDLMLGTFRELALRVRQHGGRIEKYIGDALFGLFGAPVAREDDADSALHCALALHAAIAARSAELSMPADAPLRLRIGVNTGLAVVGTVGDGHEYGAMGDTVNTAARLQTAAEPGATVVGEATWRAAQRHFAFAPPRLLELKGKSAPVLGYALLGSHATVAPAEGLGPLFDRARERARLDDWVAAVAAGHGRVGVVIGETGMGKTRLIAEAQAQAERLGLSWVQTQGQPHRQHEHGSAFDAAARSLIGLPPTPGPDETLAVLDRTLRARLAELDAEAAYPFVASRLGIPYAPELREELTRLAPGAIQARVDTAIERLFTGLAAERPLVVALDDTHWADASSISTQERLLGLTERVPLGLLYTFRPDAEPPTWRLRERAARELPHRYTELTLGPLPREASAQLVARLLGGELSSAAADVVLERAEGNPLYLEEVTRSLMEAGALERTDDGWDLAEGGEAYLPTTLHATLLARLDRLAEPTRHVLQAASVLGRQFALSVLAQLVGPDTDVETALLEAQRAGLVESLAGGAERRYQFRHGLLQEVAYDTLLLRRRRELHRAAAEALCAAAPDPSAAPVEALALHYTRAEAWPEAQAAATAAAEHAEREHAYPEAATHWEMAWRAAVAQGDAVAPRDRGALAERRGNALVLLGDFAPAQAAYETAVAAWMEEPPSARREARSRLHVRLARMALYLGDADRASAALAVAIPALGADDPLLSTALGLESQACMLRGQLHPAAVYGRRALALALRVGGPAQQEDAYAALTNPALVGELSPRERGYGQRWVALARAQGDPSQLVRALLGRAGVHISLQGTADAALQADVAEALTIGTTLRAPRTVRSARALLGGVLYLRGDWDGAARELALGIGVRPEDSGIPADYSRLWRGWLHTARGELAVGRGWYEEGLARTQSAHAPIWLRAWLAQNLRLAGDVAGVRAVLAQAAAELAALNCPSCAVVYHEVAAEEYAALGDADAALAAAAEAQQLGRALGRAPARLAAYRAQAQVALDAGQPGAALAALAPALRLAQGIDHSYERARTEHLAGRARLARGRAQDLRAARELLTHALGTFDHLGATPEAEACRAALAPLAGTPRRLPRPARRPLVRAV